MKQFIDNGVEFDSSSSSKSIQSGMSLVLLAPFKMFDTVSTRIIYLKKRQISSVLLWALIISVAVTASNAGVMVYCGKFSLFKGKFPLVAMILSSAVLLVAYFGFAAVDLIAYSQLDSLVLLKSDEKPTENENAEEFTESEEVEGTMETEEVAAKGSPVEEPPVEVSKAEMPQFKDFAESSKGSEEVPESIFTKWQSEEQSIVIGQKMSEKEMSEFEQVLKNSEDPSEFISEKLIASYTEDNLIEDEINVEILNIGVIPTKFKALA